jgi:hypothetical protein
MKTNKVVKTDFYNRFGTKEESMPITCDFFRALFFLEKQVIWRFPVIAIVDSNILKVTFKAGNFLVCDVDGHDFYYIARYFQENKLIFEESKGTCAIWSIDFSIENVKPIVNDYIVYQDSTGTYINDLLTDSFSEGCSRKAYRFGDVVVKVDSGIGDDLFAQCLGEREAFDMFGKKYTDILAPILYRGTTNDGHLFNVMPYVSRVGYTYDLPDRFKAIVENLCKEGGYGDIVGNYANWALSEDGQKLTIIDYGLDRNK